MILVEQVCLGSQNLFFSDHWSGEKKRWWSGGTRQEKVWEKKNEWRGVWEATESLNPFLSLQFKKAWEKIFSSLKYFTDRSHHSSTKLSGTHVSRTRALFGFMFCSSIQVRMLSHWVSFLFDVSQKSPRQDLTRSALFQQELHCKPVYSYKPALLCESKWYSSTSIVQLHDINLYWIL